MLATIYLTLISGPGDHPFLRSHQKLQPLAIEGSSASASQLVRRQTTEEEDMAYFEKRYKDRVRSLHLSVSGY